MSTQLDLFTQSSTTTTTPGIEWEQAQYPEYPRETTQWLHQNRHVVTRLINAIPAPTVMSLEEFTAGGAAKARGAKRGRD